MDLEKVICTYDGFVDRHLGLTDSDIQEMLATLGLHSLEALTESTIPVDIRMATPLRLESPLTDFEALARLRALHDQNKIFRSFIGMGYYDCVTPPVIQRNILENPGWYTQYTPYQPEMTDYQDAIER